MRELSQILWWKGEIEYFFSLEADAADVSYFSLYFVQLMDIECRASQKKRRGHVIFMVQFAEITFSEVEDTMTPVFYHFGGIEGTLMVRMLPMVTSRKRRFEGRKSLMLFT